MKDKYQRNIHYIRISITDRCNLRCRYCMPEGVEWIEHDQMMSYEEIVSLCQLLTQLGIDTIKITGGEPLVRKDCVSLIAKLKALPGISHVTMTTNGVLLKQYLPSLIEAGLDAVNVSLDTLNAQHFLEMTGIDAFCKVMESIEEAVKTPLKVKVNCVAFQGNNDWLKVVDLAKKYPIDVRFIEMMPIGLGKHFSTLDNRELIKTLKELYPDIKKDERSHGYGPAYYYRIPSFSGSIGFIGAIHEKFCEHCNRIRLTANGDLKACLCFEKGMNVKTLLEQSISDQEKIEELRTFIFNKPEEHCFLDEDKMTETLGMSSIGG